MSAFLHVCVAEIRGPSPHAKQSPSLQSGPRAGEQSATSACRQASSAAGPGAGGGDGDQTGGRAREQWASMSASVQLALRGMGERSAHARQSPDRSCWLVGQ